MEKDKTIILSLASFSCMAIFIFSDFKFDNFLDRKSLLVTGLLQKNSLFNLVGHKELESVR